MAGSVYRLVGAGGFAGALGEGHWMVLFWAARS
jgi:hypothetical protein